MTNVDGTRELSYADLELWGCVSEFEPTVGSCVTVVKGPLPESRNWGLEPGDTVKVPL